MYAMNPRYHDVSLYTYVEENPHTLRILHKNTQTHEESNRINTNLCGLAPIAHVRKIFSTIMFVILNLSLHLDD